MNFNDQVAVMVKDLTNWEVAIIKRMQKYYMDEFHIPADDAFDMAFRTYCMKKAKGRKTI